MSFVANANACCFTHTKRHWSGRRLEKWSFALDTKTVLRRQQQQTPHSFSVFSAEEHKKFLREQELFQQAWNPASELQHRSLSIWFNLIAVACCGHLWPFGEFIGLHKSCDCRSCRRLRCRLPTTEEMSGCAQNYPGCFYMFLQHLVIWSSGARERKTTWTYLLACWWNVPTCPNYLHYLPHFDKKIRSRKVSAPPNHWGQGVQEQNWGTNLGNCQPVGCCWFADFKLILFELFWLWNSLNFTHLVNLVTMQRVDSVDKM